MKTSFLFSIAALILFVCHPATALAGMPSITLTDVAGLRLQSISFFLAVFLLAAFLIKLLWNYLAKDWLFLPRLNYGRALVVVFLWGMLFVLVLTMISGARELMTPGAWEKQGTTYRLTQPAGTVANDLNQRRRQQLGSLGDALLAYARNHDGNFPADISEPAIPAHLWVLPDTANMRYRYLGGKLSATAGTPLAHEPEIYGAGRYVLYTNGDMVKAEGEHGPRLLKVK